MSSAAQILANQRNAEKSTGPKTLEGKARSSRNATTHGLRAENPVVAGLESQEAWEQHRDTYLADLKPEGPVETALAERIASLYWRIGRAEAFLRDVSEWGVEAKVGDLIEDKRLPRSESDSSQGILDRLRRLLDGPHANDPMVKEILSVAQRNALPEGKLLDLIIRYSGSLERALNQAERKLERLQDRRWALEERAERRADRELLERVVRRRGESKRLLELAKIDPRDPEKGSAFEQEMDRLDREKAIAPPAAPAQPRDLGSFGREALKAAPVATSVASVGAAKAAPMPPHPSEVVFLDKKGNVKPDKYLNRYQLRTREKAKICWEQAMKASQPPVAEVKIDSTSASSPISSPQATV